VNNWELEQWVRRYVAEHSVIYIANKTTLDAMPLGPEGRAIGTIAVVGTAAGVGVDMPRRYIWTGAAWQFMDWWAPAGRPGCLLTMSGVACANTATVNIAWNAEFSDPDGWHAGTSNNIIVPAGFAGAYAVSFQCLWAASASNNGAILAGLNGGGLWSATAISAFAVGSLCFTVNLAVGDVLDFRVNQSTGVSVNIISASVSLGWLGP
jgi:hypothetical protein